MTREEKIQHIENMNDALCDLCTSYQDCNCYDCDFARPISVAGLHGVIICSIDMGDFIDMAVRANGDGQIVNVMVVNGQPVALCDDTGLVKLGDANASLVSDFVNSYADFDIEHWDDSPSCCWNEEFGAWQEKVVTL